jgi:hypothetical protein
MGFTHTHCWQHMAYYVSVTVLCWRVSIWLLYCITIYIIIIIIIIIICIIIYVCITLCIIIYIIVGRLMCENSKIIEP